MTDRIDDPIDVLLVEDNPGDVRLTQEAFKQLSIETTIHVATDGDDALEFLTKRRDSDPDTVPDLVLLDLNLPRMNGLEFLETIKDDATLTRIPVLVLTSSEAVEDVLDSYELSANAYLTKPTDPTEYEETVEAVAEFWLQKAALPPVSS
ncbi:response regulator [Natronorubrum sp. DTA7]|uniref:response regulator n=1 Tax=Natronorubrum sp. DTA7 TaxID=3447016 RepID=UPI003F86C0FC